MRGNLIGNYQITGTRPALKNVLARLGAKCPVPQGEFHIHISQRPGTFQATCKAGQVPKGWGKASISLLPWRTTYLPSGREHRAECVLDAQEFGKILDARKFNSIPTRELRPR